MTNEPLADGALFFPYNNLRGPRSPAIDYAAELENRMPIRQGKFEKVDKPFSRERKLGLRNMFAMSRLSKDSQTRTEPSFQHETSLPANFTWTPLPVTDEDPEPGQWPQQYKTAPTKGRRTASRSGGQSPKDPSSAWSLPPLFKALPQAIRHVTLPATSLTAEAILRMNRRKNSLQGKRSEDATSNAMELVHDDVEGHGERSKKKTRRSQTGPSAKLKWTKKIYTLVASGYLLQYAGEGTYDRLPEKVLRLGPSSAAFATDAIPGRHWVIQVSSVADADDVTAPESRSIFSKLSFRVTERRTATNLLMVFENAESMDVWITALRTEIENQGGKKKLSETGSPKTGTTEGLSRAHASPRTLSVRDASRAATRTRNQSLDDMSTTNSIVSQDERHLDSLREASNRLSYISSGQRTFVTSSRSSLVDSPIYDKFGDGVPGVPETTQAKVRTRLHALDYFSSRESVHAMDPFADDGSSYRGSSRATSHMVAATDGERMVSPFDAKPTPNFSVPHTSGRRYSGVSRPKSRAETSSPGLVRDGGDSPMRLRRMHPTARQPVLRPAVVRDSSVTRSIATERLDASWTWPTSPAGDSQGRRLRSVSRGRATRRGKEPLPEVPRVLPGSLTEALTEEAGWGRRPRRYVSTSALRQGASSPSVKSDAVPTELPHIARMLSGHTTSFLDMGDSDGQVSTGSVLSARSSRSYDLYGSAASSNDSSDSCNTVTCSSKPDSGHYLDGERTERFYCLQTRRSMPQMAASGPPPIPPPTRALPPIPRKVQLRS
ncbi:hypothetical protein E4U41_003073 [Claviceps citrina]|nr:hypothetical protein E4U41_003073 [Claviceps citrina]